MTAKRTAGWPAGAVESCVGWTAQQHRQVAADILDSNCDLSVSEDGWDGEPAHRFYSGRSEADDARPGDPPDLAPFLAALTHAVLALGGDSGD